jgi:hypothetical protein
LAPPIDNDKAVKAIGQVLKSLFLMMYEMNPALVIVYSKIKISVMVSGE